MRRWGLGGLAIFVFALGACDGCTGCGDEDVVAEVLEVSGTVDRDWADRLEEWETAEAGAELSVGDGLRTGGGDSGARIELSDGGHMRLESETLVRFLESPPDRKGPGLDVATGEAVLEAGGSDLSFFTSIGGAVLEAGGSMRLLAEEGGLRYEVAIGRAQLEGTEGGPTTLTEGESMLVDIGGAILEGGEEEEPEDAGVPDTGPPPIEDDTPEGHVAANVQGRGVRVRGPDERRWERLEEGETTIPAGSTVRVPGRASVVLTRGEGSATLHGRGELVAVGSDDALARASSGRVTVEAGARDLPIQVPGGVIVARGGLSAGSAADAAIRGRRGTQVDVRRGRVQISSSEGAETLRVGESATLRRGGAIEIGGRGPGRADFSTSAGASFTVHDPRPPTAVGFKIGSLCSGRAVVEIMRGRTGAVRSTFSGEHQVNVSLPRGAHRYQVRCASAEGVAEDVAARGTVRVARDSGLTPLPRTAPHSIVDTDGRNYTVLYQNQLPTITIRWPEPEGAPPYTLHLEGGPGSAPSTTRASEPRHTFDSGRLPEGSYAIRFESGGGDRSRRTTLDIRFDNAAPTASVREPGNGTFSPGSTVSVSGVALPGWRAYVGGTELPMDGQSRFSGRTVVPADENGIAIRLVHPRRGVHYYLRRSGGR